MAAAGPVGFNSIPPHRTYHTSLFVNRETELQTVENKVRQAQTSNALEEPIINYWGVTGIGKTWLLRHVQHLYAYQTTPAAPPPSLAHPTFVLLYVFPGNPAVPLLEFIARSFADETLAQLTPMLSAQQKNHLEQARTFGSIDVLISELIKLSRRFVPLILLDQAENVIPTDWEEVERQLIEPLVSSGRALILVAGRRQVSRWRRFEVRRRVMEPDKCRVQAFDKHTMMMQLAQYQYLAQLPWELLFPFTGGSPHLIDVIAQHLITQQPGQASSLSPNPTWLHEHASDLLAIVRAAETQLLDHVPADLRPVLDVVSPLRFYRLESLRSMLAAQEPGTTSRSEGYYLNIRSALEQTEYVRWNRERRAYIVSKVLRQVINHRHLLQDPEDYTARHLQAINMYSEWLDQYPEISENFVVEIWFHLACLYHADPPRYEGQLRAETQRTLAFARTHLNNTRLQELESQLQADEDLLDLLSQNLLAQLL